MSNNKKQKAFITQDYPRNLQRDIISTLLVDETIFENYIGVIKPEYFELAIHQSIVETLIKYYKKYAKMPSGVEFAQAIHDFYSEPIKKGFPVEDLLEEQKRIYKVSVFAEEEDYLYIKDKIVDFLKKQAMTIALIESAKTFKKDEDYGAVQKLIDDALLVGEPLKHTAQSLGDFMEKDIEPRDIFMECWAERNALTILGGDPKVGKSILVINMLIKMVLGKPFLEFLPSEEPKKILYIQQEISEHAMKDRFTFMIDVEVDNDKERKLLDENFIQWTTTGDILKVTNINHKSQVFSAIKKHEPDLVVFDPLATFHDKSENDSIEMTKVLDIFYEMIRRFSVGIFIVHHYGKPSQVNRVSGHLFRGSSVFADRPDILINVDRIDKRFKGNPALVKHYENYAEIGFDLRSGAKPANIFVERNPDYLWNELFDDMPELTGQKITAEDIRKEVQRAGGDIMLKALLEILLRRASRRTVFKVIREAEEKGYIVKVVQPGKGKPVLIRLVEKKAEG